MQFLAGFFRKWLEAPLLLPYLCESRELHEGALRRSGKRFAGAAEEVAPHGLLYELLFGAALFGSALARRLEQGAVHPRLGAFHLSTTSRLQVKILTRYVLERLKRYIRFQKKVEIGQERLPPAGAGNKTR